MEPASDAAPVRLRLVVGAPESQSADVEARAARAADTRAYARATARVKRGERALRRGIAALDALGYAVASRGS
jgi:hypothetical protein